MDERIWQVEQLMKTTKKQSQEEQIHAFLLHPARLEVAEKALIKTSEKMEIPVRRVILRAAFGEKAFRGSTGRALKAFTERRENYNCPPRGFVQLQLE